VAEAPLDPATNARAELDLALADLNSASKKAIGEDGRIFVAAAAALELAIEALTPPNAERALAAQSCREALALLKITRAHRGGASSNAGIVLEQVAERLGRVTGLL